MLMWKRMRMTYHSQGILYNKTCIFYPYLFRDTAQQGQLFDDEYWGKMPERKEGEKGARNDMKVMFKFKVENASDNKGDVRYLYSQNIDEL